MIMTKREVNAMVCKGPRRKCKLRKLQKKSKHRSSKITMSFRQEMDSTEPIH